MRRCVTPRRFLLHNGAARRPPFYSQTVGITGAGSRHSGRNGLSMGTRSVVVVAGVDWSSADGTSKRTLSRFLQIAQPPIAAAALHCGKPSTKRIENNDAGQPEYIHHP